MIDLQHLDIQEQLVKLDKSDNNTDPIEIGKGVILEEGNELAILNLGSRLQSC